MARPWPKAFWWPWLDKLGDMTAIDPAKVHSLISFCWGAGTVEKPNLLYFRIRFLGPSPEALYENGLVFVRVARPFFLGFMLRWGGKDAHPAFLQTHIGWKLNGRLALVFRLQSDASAEVGMDVLNLGQAQGFAIGSK